MSKENKLLDCRCGGPARPNKIMGTICCFHCPVMVRDETIDFNDLMNWWNKLQTRDDCSIMDRKTKDAVLTTVEWVKSRYRYELDWINPNAFEFINNRVESDLGYLWQSNSEGDSPVLLSADDNFINHIQSHLQDGENVVCKICNKTADEIIESAQKSNQESNPMKLNEKIKVAFEAWHHVTDKDFYLVNDDGKYADYATRCIFSFFEAGYKARENKS